MILVKRARTFLHFLKAGDWQAIARRLYQYRLGWVVPDALLRKSQETVRGTMSKDEFQRWAEFQFDSFLFSGGTITLPCDEKPKLSIILVLYNKAHFTFQCLQSLAAALSSVSAEVIIVDNHSKDRTRDLLKRVKGPRVMLNDDNRGFILACNQALAEVRGEYTLFLNNDTVMYPGSLQAALSVFEEENQVGAVGGRLILPSGKLQEAGNLIFRDATCKTIARDYPPDHPSVMFRRETDYCSGAFLMTPTSLLKDMGGFDENLVPAYYEETDYCIRLRQRGYRIIYEPRVALTHFEFGSAKNMAASFAMMNRNRLKIVEKHKDFLAGQPEPYEGKAPEPRPWPKAKKRLLYIDDRPPHAHLGAGFPRSHEILKTFLQAGYAVTLYTTLDAEHAWDRAFVDFPPELEIDLRGGYPNLRGFLSARLDEFDVLWVSRPHNFSFVLAHAKASLDRFRGKVIYDAEAIFSEREALEKEATGKIVRTLYQSRRYPERSLAKHADIVVAVTEKEGKILCGNQPEKLRVVSHDHHSKPTPASFEDRHGVAILGSFHGHPSPNSDSVLWYVQHVVPLLKGRIEDTKLYVVGYNEIVDHKVFAPYREDLVFVGRVEDLGPELNKYKLMVIPTRYAAGVPQKGYDAACYGLPCVCTDLIAAQMRWRHQEECLVASAKDPQQFADQVVALYSSQQTWDHLRAGLKSYMEASQVYGHIGDNIRKLIKEL